MVVKVIIEDIVSGSPPSCLDKIYEEVAHGRQLNSIPTDFAVPLTDKIQSIINVTIGVIINLTPLVSTICLKYSGSIFNFIPAPTISIPMAKAESAIVLRVLFIPIFMVKPK
jgi:hypothetical protein